MTPQESALSEFKAFVAELTLDNGEEALAEALGRAKTLWGEVAVSLNCVRQVSHIRYRDEGAPRVDLNRIISALSPPRPPIKRRV